MMVSGTVDPFDSNCAVECFNEGALVVGRRIVEVDGGLVYDVDRVGEEGVKSFECVRKAFAFCVRDVADLVAVVVPDGVV